jgi:hypothetical protein
MPMPLQSSLFPTTVASVLAWADVKSGNGNLTLIKQQTKKNDDYDDMIESAT